MRIHEIESYADVGTKSEKDIVDSIKYFYTEHLPKIMGNQKPKILGNIAGYNVEQYKKGSNMFYFLVDQNSEPVMYVAVESFKNGVKIGNLRSSAKGMASKFYKFILDHVKIIYSDKSQTPGSKGLWNKLAKDPELLVTAIDISSGKEFPVSPGNGVVKQADKVYDVRNKEFDVILKVTKK